MNRALCNSCQKLVPAAPEERGGEIFLVKDCPSCGRTETLISGNAERYMGKRALDSGYDYKRCMLNCLECRHRKQPSFIFVDVTNRCNLNCPICINNTPSMGFVFDPPMEYFDKMFRQLSEYDPVPAVQLFGGEPTVREDLLEIIELSKSYGLPTRVVTNGLKLADEDYCRKLVETRATILIAFDGTDPETYRVLRGNEKSLQLKQKALENIRKVGGAKVALMMCVAKGFNDQEIPQLLEFCHERRDYVRGVYFMPLAHTWDLSDFNLIPGRITGEDIELAVDACFPGVGAGFIPAGAFCEIPTLMKYLDVKPPPFRGAHPNCESMYLLVSDGKGYVPLEAYLRGSLQDLVKDFFSVEKKLARRAEALERSAGGRLMAKLHLKERYLSLRAISSVVWAARRRVRLGKALKGRGIGKVWHGAGVLSGLLLGRKTRTVLERHTNLHETLQLIVLPFEDKHALETERLERCPNAFAFLDPADDRVKTVPVCAWGRHKNAVMRSIADRYAGAASLRA